MAVPKDVKKVRKVVRKPFKSTISERILLETLVQNKDAKSLTQAKLMYDSVVRAMKDTIITYGALHIANFGTFIVRDELKTKYVGTTNNTKVNCKILRFYTMPTTKERIHDEGTSFKV